MDYETLDKIADAYVPLLAVAFLGGITGLALNKPNERQVLLRVFLFFVGLLLVSYGLMSLDNALGIWPAAGLDYSTHTAVALTLVLSLCVLARQFWKPLASSFVLYALLMLYQKYHTVLDILSTMVPILLAALTLAWFLFWRAKESKSVSTKIGC